MTFCFALAMPNISIIAADTRINFTTNEGITFYQDGPDDYHIYNYDLVIPLKFRKIRRAGDGWITSSGDFLLGKSILDKLSFIKSDSFDSSNAFLIQELPKLKSEILDLTGFSEAQQSNTAILGAPFGANSVWLISLNQKRAKTEPNAGNYLASWPPEMSGQDKSAYQANFEEQFKKAYFEQNLLDILRSIVRLLYTAEQHSSTVGPFMQIGLTINASIQTKSSFYLEGNSSKILSMTDNDLKNILIKID